MRVRSLVVVLAVAGWAGQGRPARAQSASPQPSTAPAATRSEYVEVTATRIPEPADEVPASLDVILGQQLQERGATDLAGALALAAGVDVAPGGDQGPAASVPEFWGLKEFDAFLLVVDGVPRGGAFNPDLATLELADVERIEVLRGSAPVMYGATSFVGVVQVVRKSPGAAERQLRAGAGSHGSYDGAVGGHLPAWSGWSSSLWLSAERRGYEDENTAFRRQHLLWRNSHAWSGGNVWFDVDGTLLGQDPASPHPREGRALSARVPLDANHNPEGAFLDDKRGAFSGGFERPLGGLRWATTASFARSSQDAFRGFLLGVAPDGINARGLRQKIELTDVYFDSHVAWLPARRVKLVGGVDLLHGEGESEGATFDYHADLAGAGRTAAAEPSRLDLEIENRRNFGGAYGFAEWNPTAALRLEAGLRLNATREERGEEAEEARRPGEEEGEAEHTRLSGSAGLVWTPWQKGQDWVRLFAGYRDTFKPAAFDFGLGEEEEGEEGILDPETARSYEAGIRGAGAGGRFSVELSGFLMDFENLVVARTVGGVPGLVNAGTERFKGVEASAAWRLTSDLRARASYSWHDARFRDFVMEFDGVPTQLAGKRLEMSAHHMASGGLLYARPRGVLALVELHHVGSRFLNKRNTALAEGYTTVSAGLGYRFPRWELRVDGRNLGDRRDAAAESELGDAQYYRLPGRRFDASARVRF